MAALRPSFRIAARLSQRAHHLGAARAAVAAPRLLRCNNPRPYSTAEVEAAPPVPPLLQKLRADLKTAMRAKDAPRLTAIRTILALTQSAAKSSEPITTDAQLVGLLKKSSRAASDASAEFAAAARQDLVDKEEAQRAVYDEYIASSGVAKVSEAELRAVVDLAVVEEGGAEKKPRMPALLKVLMAPGGPLDGKDYDKAVLVRIVKEVLES